MRFAKRAQPLTGMLSRGLRPFRAHAGVATLRPTRGHRMGISKHVSAALAAFLFAGPPSAVPASADGSKMIGSWLVETEADRFSKARTLVIAQTANHLGAYLAVRCISGELSVALGIARYKVGDVFSVKFRADTNEVIDTDGIAILENIIQVDTSPKMIRQMMTAKEYAFRVTGFASNDVIFRAGRGAAMAIGEVAKACPLE